MIMAMQPSTENSYMDEKTISLATRAIILVAKYINRLFYLSAGGEARPVFFDIASTEPALLELDRNFELIRRELDAVLPRKQRLPSYHQLDESLVKISVGDGADKDWKVFMLFVNGVDPVDNQALCPRTTELVKQVPNLFQAFFSILDPGKSVPAHRGAYLGYLRYHLALEVPATRPPSMRIKDQRHVWQEGESILFDDTWDHQVDNDSDAIRVVLIVDILRPMPLPLHLANWLLNRLFIKNFHGKKVVEKLASFPL